MKSKKLSQKNRLGVKETIKQIVLNQLIIDSQIRTLEILMEERLPKPKEKPKQDMKEIEKWEKEKNVSRK